MALKRDYETLADLKATKKGIEKRIEHLQNKILGNRPVPERETEFGTLKLRTRSNIQIVDNLELISHSPITKTQFLQKAKLSLTTLKAMVSESDINSLIEDGILEQKKPTTFYELVKG